MESLCTAVFICGWAPLRNPHNKSNKASNTCCCCDKSTQGTGSSTHYDTQTNNRTHKHVQRGTKFCLATPHVVSLQAPWCASRRIDTLRNQPIWMAKCVRSLRMPHARPGTGTTAYDAAVNVSRFFVCRSCLPRESISHFVTSDAIPVATGTIQCQCRCQCHYIPFHSRFARFSRQSHNQWCFHPITNLNVRCSRSKGHESSFMYSWRRSSPGVSTEAGLFLGEVDMLCSNKTMWSVCPPAGYDCNYVETGGSKLYIQDLFITTTFVKLTS